MNERRQQATDSRSNTDACLAAEREISDASNQAKFIAQRVLDDVLGRDRLLADQGLVRSRAHADDLIDLERAASPPRDTMVVSERSASDEEKLADREMSDRVIKRERERSDTRSDAVRQSVDTADAEQGVLQRDTDRRLEAERIHADKAEELIENATTVLESMEEEQNRRRDILAIVGHDLRDPLTAITLGAEMLVAKSEDADPRKVAAEIVRAAARMKRMLTDLLDVARIDAGVLEVVKCEHNVNSLMREVSRLYGPQFVARALTFTVDEPAAPMTGYFDYDRVLQVLSNLLGNALKFSSAEGSVNLCVRPRAGGVEFEIRNDGPAIPPAALPHLFQRFWPIDSHDRRGLGLGLYICKQIVEQHGGRIWVESRAGEGTVFRFTLPTA